jgi:hypothetical protein
MHLCIKSKKFLESRFLESWKAGFPPKLECTIHSRFHIPESDRTLRKRELSNLESNFKNCALESPILQ